VLLLIVAFAIMATKRNRVAVIQTFDVAAAPAVEGGPQNARVLFSEPFELSGKQNVVVDGSALLQNSWLYVVGDLVNEATSKTETFELPLEYYHGVADGERWEEGKPQRRVFLSAPDKGRYVLRLEVQWQEGGGIPPSLHVRVREGVFRTSHFIFAAILISVFPLLAVFRQFRFEQQRWKDSAYSPYGSFKIDDEEDDE